MSAASTAIRSFDELFVRSVLTDGEFLGAPLPPNCAISIDSRTLEKGALFVALKGSVVDGHTFCDLALQNGACAIMIEKSYVRTWSPEVLRDKTIIRVADTHKALLALAHAWRQRFSIPVVGITGSIGKTSTKELLAAIVRRAGKNFLVTPGNNNTLLGVSLAVLRLRPEHEGAIFEMGINKPGEMARLAAMVRPTTAIITYIGHSHLEGLGTTHDVASEKRDIFSQFAQDNVGIVNGDQPVLASIAYPHPIIKFGCKTTNQIQARKVRIVGESIHCTLKIYGEKYPVVLPTNHTGRITQVLAAAAAAHVLGISPSTVVSAVQEPVVVAGRFEVCALVPVKGVLINDAYNASPESTKAALVAFDQMACSGRKIAILGDMRELGQTAPFWHRQIGRYLRRVPSIRTVIFVGDAMRVVQPILPVGIQALFVATWQEARDILKNELVEDSVVLLKGSNGVGLYNIARDVSIAQPRTSQAKIGLL